MVLGPLSPTWASDGPSQAARVVIPGSLSWRVEGGWGRREGRQEGAEREMEESVTNQLLQKISY